MTPLLTAAMMRALMINPDSRKISKQVKREVVWAYHRKYSEISTQRVLWN